MTLIDIILILILIALLLSLTAVTVLFLVKVGMRLLMDIKRDVNRLKEK